MAEETKGTATSKKAVKKKAVSKKRAGVRKAMAKRKPVGEHGSKVAFIMKHAALKPLEVEAKAKEAGMDIKAGYVSSVRSKAKASERNGARGKSSAKSPVTQHLEHVRALRGVILHVGIDRAKEMMDQIVKDLMV